MDYIGFAVKSAKRNTDSPYAYLTDFTLFVNVHISLAWSYACLLAAHVWATEPNLS